jgi:uncharacterized RDD family membrane protein YckC
MKNIEIMTTQNVVLQYELAGLKDRALAFFIDALVIVVGFSILVGIGTLFVGESESGLAVMVFIVMGMFMFYSLLFETLNKGQSIGKMALRIQVIKVAGSKITFSDYVARWVFRLIDIYFSIGTIASILVVSSAKGQRIGDIVANTAVVKTMPRLNLTLQDLLALHEKKSYTPKYLQARKLHEDDALLIKSALDRYRKFDNESHEEAIELLTNRIKEVLNIGSDEGDKTRFLQTVLQDYIILTR